MVKLEVEALLTRLSHVVDLEVVLPRAVRVAPDSDSITVHVS